MAMKRTLRPRDPIALAKLIGDIATGQVVEKVDDRVTLRAKTAGKKGGPARAAALSPEQRADIARTAAEARWKKS